MNRRALLILVVGGIAAAVVGGLVGSAVVAALGIDAAYSRSLVVGLLVAIVAYTERMGDRFDRAAYETERETAGQVLDMLLVAVAGLLGGVAGTAIALALSLSVGIAIVVVFGLGFLTGMAPFVARNREFYVLSG